MKPILQTLARIDRALILEAVEELKRRKLRTLLTLLGMIFGVGAIIAMLAVGEGSRREALRLVTELGLNNLIVRTKSLEPDTLREVRKRSLGLSSGDAEALRSVVPGATVMPLTTNDTSASAASVAKMSRSDETLSPFDNVSAGVINAGLPSPRRNSLATAGR